MKLSIEFAQAVVWAWGKRFKLGAALTHWKQIPIDRNISSEEWRCMWAESGADGTTNAGWETTAWVAKHFENANDALWSGKTDLAWKWMASGKDVPSVAPKREAHKRPKVPIFIRARELDKAHDWKTVK